MWPIWSHGVNKDVTSLYISIDKQKFQQTPQEVSVLTQAHPQLCSHTWRPALLQPLLPERKVLLQLLPHYNLCWPQHFTPSQLRLCCICVCESVFIQRLLFVFWGFWVLHHTHSVSANLHVQFIVNRTAGPHLWRQHVTTADVLVVLESSRFWFMKLPPRHLHTVQHAGHSSKQLMTASLMKFPRDFFCFQSW